VRGLCLCVRLVRPSVGARGWHNPDLITAELLALYKRPLAGARMVRVLVLWVRSWKESVSLAG